MAFNLVLSEFTQLHGDEIEARHLDGLTADEVIFTTKGANIFDEQGKLALLGRAFMFMDALDPKIVQIDRATDN